MTKHRRLRGSRTYGRGSKKHKSGSRGGTGRAGSFQYKKLLLDKRSHNQKNSFKKLNYIKFQDLLNHLDYFLSKEIVVESSTDGKYIIDLNKLNRKIIGYKTDQDLSKFIFKGSKKFLTKRILESCKSF
jgi:ribosomal protein L15